MERGLCIVRDGPKRTYDAMFRKAKALHITGNKVFGYDNVPVYGSGTNATAPNAVNMSSERLTRSSRRLL